MIFASLGLDWANFQRGIQGAMTSTRQLGATMQQSMSGGVAAGIMSAAANISAIDIALRIATFSVRGFYDALDFGGQLADQTAQTGVAVDKLMELQFAFELAGMTAKDVQPSLAKLQRNIAEAASGSAQAAQKFQIMGVSLDEIGGLSADEQLMKVGNAINKIENPTQRAAMAMEIFGKSGGKLLTFFSDMGMEGVQNALGKQSAVMLQNAGVFARSADALNIAGVKVRGFFVGLASNTAPQLIELVDKLEKMDLTHVGESLGNGIAIAVELLDRVLQKVTKVMDMGEKAAKTQGTYGAQSFMGMGGMGMGGAGTALSAAVESAGAEQPKTTFFDDILNDIEKKRAAAREKYGTPPPGDTGAGFLQKAGAASMPQMIASSAAKVGALGGAVWGGDGAVNVQRDQLAVQQRIANSIDRFLQAAQPDRNPYLGGVTPQLGVI